MKVKTFWETGLSELESSIHSFLKTVPDIKLEEVKYQTSPYNKDYIAYTCIIFYTIKTNLDEPDM